MKKPSPIKLPIALSVNSNITKRNGSACSTAVAFGVKPKNLKASGPEKALPILRLELWFYLWLRLRLRWDVLFGVLYGRRGKEAKKCRCDAV